jgi:hypothetical protein
MWSDQNAIMSRMIIRFACGATYETDSGVEPEKTPRGNFRSYMVFALGVDSVAPPKLDGKPARCFGGCPAPVRLSHRQEQRGWVGDAAVGPTGEPTRCVLCRPTHVLKADK